MSGIGRWGVVALVACCLTFFAGCESKTYKVDNNNNLIAVGALASQGITFSCSLYTTTGAPVYLPATCEEYYGIVSTYCTEFYNKQTVQNRQNLTATTYKCPTTTIIGSCKIIANATNAGDTIKIYYPDGWTTTQAQSDCSTLAGSWATTRQTF